jgi:hypothetical protein
MEVAPGRLCAPVPFEFARLMVHRRTVAQAAGQLLAQLAKGRRHPGGSWHPCVAASGRPTAPTPGAYFPR